MNLRDLEARLQSLLEVQLIRVVPGQKAEDLLVHKLTEAMHARAVPDGQGGKVAPNVYTILAHPDSLQSWRKPGLLDTLIQVLEAAGEQAEANFEAAPSITIAEDPSLERGDFHVIASFRAEPLAETKDMKTKGESDDMQADDAIPENAFLIVEGVKMFPLKESVVNIGRRLDNGLVVDDPRVSRNHAQLRAIKGRYVLFDLNSTGGTFVNGQRANQTILYPGDVISLAGVSLIFGQDSATAQPDLSDTEPRNDAGADRSTAVIRTANIPRKKEK